jgi:hypothetical protein
MIASNLLFSLIPVVLLDMKNNSSKYEQNITAALNMPCMLDSDM